MKRPNQTLQHHDYNVSQDKPMHEIVRDAIRVRREHIGLGIPMNVNQGFKEVNIAFALWIAFHRAGYFGFPEFPYRKGSIDAIFLRGEEIVICEWKQVYRSSAPIIVEQTSRMLRFDPIRELAKHRIASRAWKTRRLWVCDTWEQRAVDWWMGRETKIRTPSPFDSEWTVGKEDFEDFGDGWFPYCWLWAFT